MMTSDRKFVGLHWKLKVRIAISVGFDGGNDRIEFMGVSSSSSNKNQNSGRYWRRHEWNMVESPDSFLFRQYQCNQMRPFIRGSRWYLAAPTRMDS
jgi:hypothetical protein